MKIEAGRAVDDEQAFIEGMQARVNSQSRCVCPYDISDSRCLEFDDGWRYQDQILIGVVVKRASVGLDNL